MRSALIGSTGYVGGTLLRQTSFDDHFHSTDIDSIAGRRYDLIVCAGAPAEKWRANADPEGDAARLRRLAEPLLSAETSRLVLISTVDVYPRPIDVDERTPIPPSAGSAYGRHRRQLEVDLSARFPTVIIRLPGLFGRGLKKNVIFDFLHDNQLDRVHADGVFQFYDLENLWDDVQRTLAMGIDLVNIATEPVSVRDVARHAFDRDFDNAPPGAAPARYDVRSIHAEEFGGREGYMYDRESVLRALRTFVDASRPTP